MNTYLVINYGNPLSACKHWISPWWVKSSGDNKVGWIRLQCNLMVKTISIKNMCTPYRSLFRLRSSWMKNVMMAIIYMWSATCSGLGTPRFTQPVLLNNWKLINIIKPIEYQYFLLTSKLNHLVYVWQAFICFSY